MDHGLHWFPSRLIFGLSVLLASSCLGPSPLVAGPLPDDSSSGNSIWTPWSNWQMPDLRLPAWRTPQVSMPTLPAPREPAFVRATRQGLGQAWTSTKRTTHSAWKKTQDLFTPGGASSEREKRRDSGNAQRDTGFWASLFAPSKPQKPPTVNDFLRQPAPF